MSIKMRTLRTSAAIAALSGVGLAAVHAQDRVGSISELETVVVTGSLIKREVGDVAQPVTTISAEDLARSGATNAERMLQQIAQNQSVAISNINLGGGTGGASYANLRALGSARTLVLVNGKRVVNNAYQSLGVDLNTIPTALIDRIEVLSDGGSATYGTDAIAGVMNFITVENMQGVAVSANVQAPEASGGGEVYQASLSAGAGSLHSDHWAIFGGVTWRKQELLPATARDFTRTGLIPEHGLNRLQSTTFPANYTQSASGITSPRNPTAPQCNPPFSLRDPATGVCGYDQLARINQIPPQEQGSLYLKAATLLGDQTASLEYLRAENESTVFLSEQGVSGLSMTAANPYFPGQGITPGSAGLNPALPISVNWRTVEAGRRENTFEGYTDRIIAQLEGAIASWDYQVSALRSTSTTKVVFKQGFPDEQRMRDGVAGINGAPFLNPFGSQSDAGRQFLDAIQVRGEAQRAEGELSAYGAQVNRELWHLPGGALALALAIEFKHEEADFLNNMQLIARVPSSFGSVNDISGERDAKSLAVEVNLPVLRSLEVGLAGRYDDYDDFGDTVNPEFSARFQPIDMLTFRASYGTGFRAPTLYDTLQPNTLGSTAQRFNDPVLCPRGVVNVAAGGNAARDCNSNFGRLVGGNRELDPEESDTLSVGFQIEPGAGLTFGVDYWSYNVDHTLSPLAEQAIFSDPIKYAGLFVRCSQLTPEQQVNEQSCLTPGGDPLAYILTTVQNLGTTRTSGYDGLASWTSPSMQWGRLGLSYRGTYVSEYEFQREPGGPYFSRAGHYIDGSPVMRYVHVATLSWARDAWDTRLTSRYKSAYEDCNCGAFFNRVDANSLWDLSVTYSGVPNLTLSFSVLNMLDEEPPFSNKSAGLSVAFDDRYADPLLRTYLLGASFKFW